jgi:hypothetical protein
MSTRRARPNRPDPLDLDTVRLERGTEPGVWQVLAGEAEQPVLVGFLEPASSGGCRSKRWIARTARTGPTVPGGPWIIRKGALVHLVDDYQRPAGAEPKRPDRAAGAEIPGTGVLSRCPGQAPK